jgi:putative spermidine/putrescine transport system ATP-binding protein
MQVELKTLQRDVGITFVFVTHDQSEALTMSDRIAVFNAGRIEQVGPPAQVYERPASEFVAGFVGTSNLLRGATARALLGRGGVWSIRPEKIRLAEPDAAVSTGEGSALGTVQDVIYLGDATRFVVGLDAGGTLVVLQQNLSTSSTDVHDYRGRRVRLAWRSESEFAVGSAA